MLLVKREFPKSEIDHINRNRTDNRIENLRESNRKQQIENSVRKPNRETGVAGVHIDHTKGLKKKFAFNFEGKKFRFYTLEEAIKERENVRKTHYDTVKP